MIWLTVLTTPRRPQYLTPTLENIDLQGGAAYLPITSPIKKIVMVDGPTGPDSFRPGWSTHSLSDQSDGSRMSLYRIMVLAAQAGAEFVIYCEDDIRVCRYAIDAIIDLRVPRDCGFLTFCNQKKGYNDTPAIHRRPGDHPSNAPGHWGTQAMKIPKGSLEHFAKKVIEPRGQYRYGSDNYIGHVLASSTAPTQQYGIVIPGIVKHVGENTTIESQTNEAFGGHRLGLNYPGDDYDARNLLTYNLH